MRRNLDIARAAPCHEQGAQMIQYSRLPTEDHVDDNGAAPGKCTDKVDIVQFACAIMYVEEDEGHIAIDIMRLGSMEGTVSVKFFTEDGSAKAGFRYQYTSEIVTFNDGEYTKTVNVPILNSAMLWTPTYEFKAQLSAPRGCELGAYLKSCRIKVIDQNPFPSSAYEEQLWKGLPGINEINGFFLFLDYCRLNMTCPGVAWRTAVILIMDQLQNLYSLLIITMKVYMVDTLFATSDPLSEMRLFFDSRLATSYLVAACFVAPMLILHVWDFLKIKIDLNGRSRVYLQTNLFSEYLNYSEHSRETVPVTDVHDALLSDCKELAEGYETLLKFAQLIGKLCVGAAVILRTSTKDRTAIYLMGIVPIIITIFGAARKGKLLLATERVQAARSEFSELVKEACDNYRLFANYFQRPLINAHFYQTVYHLRGVELLLNLVDVNNEYFSNWLGPLIVAMFIVLCTPSVLGGVMGVGVFLATIDILQQMSQDLGLAYLEAMKLYQTFDTLRSLCILYNMPSDLRKWKDVNRARRLATKKARDDILKDTLHASKILKGSPQGRNNCVCPVTGSEVYMSDAIPIYLDHLHYCTPSGNDLFKVEGRLQVPQGKLVAVRGKHGAGKTTLLRLIAHELFPTHGDLFIPSHLRILHVSQEVMVLQDSAWQNLIFGCNTPLSDVDLQRVEMVTERLGMSKLLQFLLPDFEQAKLDRDMHRRPPDPFGADISVPCCPPFSCDMASAERVDKDAGNHQEWIQTLSYTEKVKLHLARAFLMNPEVMVLQRPLYHFSQESSLLILELLREHVDNRGIGMPEGSRGHRRPRTVFYTSETGNHEEVADVIWQVEGHSVSERTSEVRDAMASQKPQGSNTALSDLMMFEESLDCRRQGCPPQASPSSSDPARSSDSKMMEELGKACLQHSSTLNGQEPGLFSTSGSSNGHSQEPLLLETGLGRLDAATSSLFEKHASWLNRSGRCPTADFGNSGSALFSGSGQNGAGAEKEEAPSQSSERKRRKELWEKVC